MKKAFDQTVRDIKRGVNKKVLKVPSIEQKVLDATSNESWGPHGSLLADIAQASRNYHEYQMIMSVIWKRVNDTGKNWRHVYKGLTVLEYLVANGSERVIDEIREHAYQVSSLSDFQYIDSTGKDQGSNVRKKSQSLVELVNDKEKIQEVREKAAANWDKFHNTSGGGKYRQGGYDDNRNEGRYGSRDEDRNGYTREREWGGDKYGRYGDSYGEERYSRDEEYRGRRSVDGDNYGRRSRSSDREKERAYEDDGQYSSRESNEKADDQSHDGRHLEQKSSEQNSGGPPSYEDAVGGGRSPVYSEGEAKFSSPPVTTTHETTVSSSPAVAPAPVAATLSPPPVAATLPPSVAASNKENDGFDEFDPRGSVPGTTAAPAPSGGAEMDLFGSFSDSFSSDALALVPTTTPTTTSEVNTFTNSNPPGQTFSAASLAPAGSSQAFEDPFGNDNPFRAVPSTDGFSGQPQSASTFGQSVEPPQSAATFGQSVEPPQSAAPVLESGNNFGYGGSFDQNTDFLADLLPLSGPSQSSFHAQPAQLPAQTGFLAQPNPTQLPSGFPGQPGQPSFQGGQPPPQPGFPTQDGQFMPPHGGQTMSQPGFPPHGGQNTPLGGFPVQTTTVSQAGFPVQTTIVSQAGFPVQATAVSQAGFPGSNGQPTHPNNFYGGFPTSVPAVTQVIAAPAAQSDTSNFYQQPQLNASTGALAIVPQQEAKFETKSTVWADTLNRGLVNLNISGSKTNPLSDIGIDFEALNRKEKRMEKPSMVPVTSNVTMGKAMGSGTGIGRAGVGALRAQPNPMMGSTMAGPGAAPGYGAGYGGMNQPMGQGFPPGSAMAGPYTPMMGGGGYGQQPYGGGYR